LHLQKNPGFKCCIRTKATSGTNIDMVDDMLSTVDVCIMGSSAKYIYSMAEYLNKNGLIHPVQLKSLLKKIKTKQGARRKLMSENQKIPIS